MKNKVSKEEIHDFWSMFFIIFGSLFSYVAINNIVRSLISWFFIGLGLFLISKDVLNKFRNKEYTIKQIRIVMVIAVVGLFVWHKIPETYIATVIAMKYVNEDLRKMIKYIFFSSLFSYFLVVFMCLIGALDDVVGYRDGSTIRLGLGFANPNLAVRFFVPILLSGAILYKNDKKVIFLFMLASAVLFLLTNSRAGIVVCFLFCIISLLPKGFKRKVCNIKFIPYMFLIGFVTSLIISLYFDNSELLNNYLNNRPLIWRAYVDNFGFFGKFKRAHNYPADNVFIHILYYGGILGLVSYFVLYFSSFRKTGFKNNYNVFIVFLTVFIYGMVENHSDQGESFYLLLIIIQLLDCNKLKELDDDYVEEKLIKSTN